MNLTDMKQLRHDVRRFALESELCPFEGTTFGQFDEILSTHIERLAAQAERRGAASASQRDLKSEASSQKGTTLCPSVSPNHHLCMKDSLHAGPHFDGGRPGELW